MAWLNHLIDLKTSGLTYLFELRPYTSDNRIKIMLAVFALIIIAGLIVKIYQATKKLEKFQAKLLKKYFSLLTTMGFWGLVMAVLRYERVPLLAARFWMIIWLAVLIVWLYPIIKYQWQVVPAAKKQAEEKKLFQKYLPKKGR